MIPHALSLSCYFNTPKPIKSGNTLKGMTFRATTTKSRLAGAPEYAQAEITFDFDVESNRSEVALIPEIPVVAQKLGVFTKSDGTASYDGHSKYFDGALVGNNPQEMQKNLALDDDLYKAVYKACRAALDARQQAIRNNQGVQNGSEEWGDKAS